MEGSTRNGGLHNCGLDAGHQETTTADKADESRDKPMTGSCQKGVRSRPVRDAILAVSLHEGPFVPFQAARYVTSYITLLLFAAPSALMAFCTQTYPKRTDPTTTASGPTAGSQH
jgi:hypothetical protein